MTPQEILDLPMQDNDAMAKSIQEYLGKLLWELWLAKDEFSGKRPFGNSDWEYEVYKALITAGAVSGEVDEDGYLTSCDTDSADVLIRRAIEHMMGEMPHG